MADNATMRVQPRHGTGKGAARAVRRAGFVPGVIYGAKKDPVLLQVDPRDIIKGLEGGTLYSTVYMLEIGKGSERVLAREVQLHPITDMPEHIDFLRVSQSTRVTVEVPVTVVNEEESPGLEAGGVLSVVRHTVEVTCRADNIPHDIVADLKGLEINDTVHSSDVSLPDGVEFAISDRDFVIATITAPQAMKQDEDVVEEVEGEEAEGEEAEGEEAEGGDAEAEGSEEEKE